MNKTIKIRFRLWIDADNVPYLGLGRVVLLEQIIKHGSITKGAAAINMSYRKAWQLVENMNKIANKPLVRKRLGGKNGGGAEVTAAGEKAIKTFYQLQKKVETFLEATSKDIMF